MIVLKILLWIFLAVIGIILLFLVVPASAEVAYIDKKFTYKFKYGFINLFDSEKKGIAGILIKKFKGKKKSDDYDDSDDFTMPEPDEIYDNTDSPETEDIPDDDYTAETETAEEIPEETEDKKRKDKPEKVKKEKSDSKADSLIDKIDEYEDKIEFMFDILRSADRPLIHLFKGFRFSRIYIDFMIAGDDAYKCAMNYGRISGAVYNLLGWLGTVCTASFETVDIFPDFKAQESRWDISVKFSFKFITPIVAGILFLITYIFRFFIPQKLQERKLKKSKK